MDPRYHVRDGREILSPGMLLFRDLLDENLRRMIVIAGNPDRLRPHCKTHKMARVTERELAAGITKHKCATIAEAEMLARAGVRDIVLAYNLVGPNVARAVRFVETFPDVRFAATADHPGPIEQLSGALQRAGRTMELLLDVDLGQHRTGVPAGPRAAGLYRQIARSPGLKPGGLHCYDGHQHQADRNERRAAVMAEFGKVLEFRDALVAEGLPVPRLVCGGTASFPVYAELTDQAIELSPGTIVFHDAGYSEMFPDLEFVPAVMLLTRVISRPAEDRITCDLGYKAVASDPPAGKRLRFPDLPDAEAVLQNEEHLVLKTAQAARFQPGDELLAIPRHVCPTTALHRQVYVISGGELVDRWDVTARDRWLEI